MKWIAVYLFVMGVVLLFNYCAGQLNQQEVTQAERVIQKRLDDTGA
jgi:hypothetical protein